MKLNALRSFVRVADLKSFSQAARELHYTQSAVTIQIQQLEKEFDQVFFDRIGNEVRLTEPGKRFYDHAQQILMDVRSAKDDMGATEIMDPLHIGAIDSIGQAYLRPVLSQFYKAHPRHPVQITTGSPQDIMQMLNQNEIDMAYVLDQPLYDINWLKPIDEEARIVFACAPDNPLAQAKDLRLADLLNQPFLVTEAQDNYQFALQQELAKRRLNLNPCLTVSNTDMLVNLAAENLGLTFLPEYALSEALDQGRLVLLPLTDFHMVMHRQLIIHKRKWLSRAMKDFIALAQTPI